MPDVAAPVAIARSVSGSPNFGWSTARIGASDVDCAKMHTRMVGDLPTRQGEWGSSSGRAASPMRQATAHICRTADPFAHGHYSAFEAIAFEAIAFEARVFQVVLPHVIRRSLMLRAAFSLALLLLSCDGPDGNRLVQRTSAMPALGTAACAYGDATPAAAGRREQVGLPSDPLQMKPHRRAKLMSVSTSERTKVGRGRPRFDPRNLQIGSRLKRLRRDRKLSQIELGDLLGVSSQQIHRYETGKSTLSALALWQIAHALDVPLDVFFTEIQTDLRTPSTPT